MTHQKTTQTDNVMVTGGYYTVNIDTNYNLPQQEDINITPANNGVISPEPGQRRERIDGE